jgi:hypothetical protein
MQPTIPVITIETEDGVEVAKAFALLNGMQTKHSATFGLNTPLAQDTVHRFKIVAWDKSSFGSNEAVVTGKFRTGNRDALVFLDKLVMLSDADIWSAGAGEINFAFGAGDVDAKEAMGDVILHSGNISDQDPPIEFNNVIEIPAAPSRLWLQANATEDDSTILDAWLGDQEFVGIAPSFTAEGTTRSE